MATDPPGSAPSAETEISGAALAKEVTAALRAAGFTWVQSIALKRRPGRPNWQIVRLIGSPPGPKAYVDATKHPLIAEMQKKYVLTGVRE